MNKISTRTIADVNGKPHKIPGCEEILDEKRRVFVAPYFDPRRKKDGYILVLTDEHSVERTIAISAEAALALRSMLPATLAYEVPLVYGLHA